MKKTKNDSSLQALALERSESYFDSTRSLKKPSTSIWVQSKNLSPVLSLLQTPFVTDLEMHRHGVRASVRNVLNSNDAKVMITMFHIHAPSKIQAMSSDLMWRHGYCRGWHRRDFPHVFTGAPDIEWLLNTKQKLLLGCIDLPLKNGMLHHSLGRAVIFLSLRHFISPSLNFMLCLCVFLVVYCILALLR